MIRRVNLFSRFATTADQCAEKTAICWGDAELSYGWLRRRAARLASKLRKEGGLQAGDRVAIWLKNCPEFPATLFGVWQAGGVVVMINNFLKPDEVDFILSDSGATAVITDESLADSQSELESRGKGWKFFRIEDYEAWTDEAESGHESVGEDLAALLYTSGTTGQPKGAMLTHGNFLHNVASCAECLEISADDRMVVVLPQFHSFMFTVGTLLPLLSGAGIVLLKSLHPFKNVLVEIIKRKGTILPAVPPLYRSLVQAKEIPPLPLRLCISGGAPLPVETLREFQNRFEYPLVEGYGPTESSPVATVNPLRGTRKPGSVGVPIPNVELSIRNDDGGEFPVGETGELCIRGGNVMRGYWNQPEETGKTIRDGWLYTGDIGHQDEDNFFYITDRKKDMLLVNGINVYPREIEEVIYQYPGVKEAAVIGLTDPRKGEQPIAYISPADDATVENAELLAFIRSKLADYKIPREIRQLEALPRNATGKILKTALRQMAQPEVASA
jgi:long-chain acyl-CoA synthetase